MWRFVGSVNQGTSGFSVLSKKAICAAKKDSAFISKLVEIAVRRFLSVDPNGE